VKFKTALLIVIVCLLVLATATFVLGVVGGFPASSVKNESIKINKTIESFEQKLSHGNRFDDPNYRVWFFNESDDPIGNYDVNGKFLTLRGVKNFSRAFVLMKRDIDNEPKGIISMDLFYRDNNGKEWVKGIPYKKYDIVFEEPDIYNESWYSFWIEHLTDFYVNSTNDTISSCILKMNNTADNCIINGNGYTSIVNGSYVINNNGSVKYSAFGINIDYNNTIFNYENGGGNGYCVLRSGIDLGNNSAFKNIVCNNVFGGLYTGGIIFDNNIDAFNWSFSNITVTNTGANSAFRFDGKNSTISNLNISNHFGSAPTIFLNTVTTGNVFLTLTNSSIINSSSEGGGCIYLPTGLTYNWITIDGVVVSDSCSNGYFFVSLVGLSNSTFLNIKGTNVGNINSTATGLELASGNNYGDILITNFTMTNYSLDNVWVTDSVNATYNGVQYDTMILVDSDDVGNTPITTIPQNVNGVNNGLPDDGTANYSFWLINGAVLNYVILAKELGGGTCTTIAGLVAGTCDVQIDNFCVTNGLADYTCNSSMIWNNITLERNLRIDYNLDVFKPILSIDAYTNVNVSNSTFSQPSDSFEFTNSLLFTGVMTGSNVFNNIFLHTPLNNSASGINFCVDIPSSDLTLISQNGDANNTVKTYARRNNNDPFFVNLSNDGNTSTYYKTSVLATSEQQWVLFDLGDNYSIENFVENGAFGVRCENFTYELSRDNITYTPVLSKTTESFLSTRNYTINTTVAQYARYNCTSAKTILGTQSTWALTEWEIYGREFVSTGNFYTEELTVEVSDCGQANVTSHVNNSVVSNSITIVWDSQDIQAGKNLTYDVWLNTTLLSDNLNVSNITINTINYSNGVYIFEIVPQYHSLGGFDYNATNEFNSFNISNPAAIVTPLSSGGPSGAVGGSDGGGICLLGFASVNGTCVEICGVSFVNDPVSKLCVPVSKVSILESPSIDVVEENIVGLADRIIDGVPNESLKAILSEIKEVIVYFGGWVSGRHPFIGFFLILFIVLFIMIYVRNWVKPHD